MVARGRSEICVLSENLALKVASLGTSYVKRDATLNHCAGYDHTAATCFQVESIRSYFISTSGPICLHAYIHHTLSCNRLFYIPKHVPSFTIPFSKLCFYLALNLISILARKNRTVSIRCGQPFTINDAKSTYKMLRMLQQ